MEEDSCELEEKPEFVYDGIESIEPLPEKKEFNIQIVEWIQEGSNFESESDCVDDRDLEDVVCEDEEDKEQTSPLWLDEDSILEKFLNIGDFAWLKFRFMD